MGRHGTYNYQAQIDEPGTEPGTIRQVIIGANTYKEAEEKLIEEARRIKSTTGYIWAQTKIGKRKLDNLGADYIKYFISLESDKYLSHNMRIGQS